MSKKKTCAFCKKKMQAEEMFVKHAGKHNTYWCCEEHYNMTMERKKKREANKEKKNGIRK